MFHSASAPRRAVVRSTRRLAFERLEDRHMLAAFNVTSAADLGTGTLRDAIEGANLNPGPDKILFAAALSGQTINIGSSLPQIAESLKIINKNGQNVTVDGQDIADVRPFNIAAAASVTLKKLTITGGHVNGGDDGGGVVNQGGMLTLNECVVTGNQALGAVADGGGVANLAGGLLIIKNSTISNNRSDANGGGISNRGGELQVSGTNVNGNTAADGGGVANVNSASASIEDSTIAGNLTSGSGGGISNGFGALLTVERSTISGNRAVFVGGGVINEDTASFFNCTIAHNLSLAVGAAFGGGGIATSGSTLTLVNCTIVGNADTGNRPEAAGGITKVSGTLDLRNTIVAGNFAGPDSADDNVELSDLNLNVNNFIGGNPRLGPLDFNGGPTQTMAPLGGSPVINTGDNDAANQFGLTTDQRGLTRIVGGTVDIGAAETQIGEPLPLRSRATGPPTGGSASARADKQPVAPSIRRKPAALTTFVVTNTNDSGNGSLRDAIDDANANPGEDKIRFLASLSGQTISIDSSLPQITESLKVINKHDQNVTVDGQDIENVRPFNIAAAATVTLKQLTITGGLVSGDDIGGAIFLRGGVLTLNTCIVTGNFAIDSGGGIAIEPGGELTVKDSTISNNRAQDAGGGIFNDDGVVTLDGVTVTGNTSVFGAGIFNSGSSASATINNSTIAANVAGLDGGGIASTAALTLNGCTISGNRADRAGGGVLITADTADFFNTTIAYNISGGAGGGIAQATSQLTLVNCTIVGNADTSNLAEGAGGIAAAAGVLLVRNTVIANNAAGPDSVDPNVSFGDLDESTGNLIGLNPQLGPLDANGGPTLTMAPFADSGVIDAGSNTAATDASLTVDQRGLARIVGGTVDTGAVERQAGEPLP